ncbi:NBS-containing resistance-like protein, partial [Trifolium pratense]
GIAAKIIESNINVEMDKMQLELLENVEGKRYLFVLDDIWNEDRDHWLQLMTLPKDGANGRVPLAIRIIGSQMFSMEDWSTFKNIDLMKIDEQGGNKNFQLVKLSYE